MDGWVGGMVIIGHRYSKNTNSNTDHLLLPVRAGKGKSLQCSGSPLTACRITCVSRCLSFIFDFLQDHHRLCIFQLFFCFSDFEIF